MTGRNTPSPDSVLHLVKEAGVDEDPALLEAVRDIAELADRPAPEPSADLAQLMASGGKTPGSRRTKGRITFIGGALAVSMGVGMSGVAAGPVDRQEELDGSVDSVIRFWARDHVDRTAPGVVAGPEAVAPTSSDAAGAGSPAGTVPVAPATAGGVESDGGAGAGGSEFDAGRPAALPAGHQGAAPTSSPGTGGTASPSTGGTAPSPSRQSAQGGAASAGTPAPNTSVPDTSAPQVAAPDTTDARASTPHSADSQGGTGTSTDDAGESGGTVTSGVAEVPNTAVDIPRHVEEPVRFATLAWVSEDPDESMTDAAPGLVWLRTPGAAPDNVVFLLSQPISDDGPWLALFIPDAPEPVGDPATEEYVPWEPVAREPHPDAPSDLLPEKATPPIGQPGEELVEELAGDAQPSRTPAQTPVPDAGEIVPPPTDVSETAAGREPVEAVPRSDPSGGASEEELRTEPVPDAALAELHTTGPAPSSQKPTGPTELTEPTKLAPGLPEEPTPLFSEQPTTVPVDEATGTMPNPSDDPAANEPSANEPSAEPAQ